jgi:hypothetical protein
MRRKKTVVSVSFWFMFFHQRIRAVSSMAEQGTLNASQPVFEAP